VLGNDELALAVVMTVGVVVALFALLAVGVREPRDDDDVAVGMVADPA
jgi:DHA1 family bicyclomycin/chloramphenicol resistance-like MFS transporter